MKPITGLPNHLGTQGENEGLADRNIIRYLRRHVVDEVFAFLTHLSTEPLPGLIAASAAPCLGHPPDRHRLGRVLPAASAPRTRHPHRPDFVYPGQHLDEIDHQHLTTD
ncbi:hypothetical protein [Kocuria rosea]|uniref:hypothetical protein n=1 Tax=Kocuria rosea TaxID=1275 RepID=UPI00253F7BBF|nr:hypothetical protein [Kocuria rosea]WIG16254.1 hypothetical protein QOY29_11200 [Kocuria rosea]